MRERFNALIWAGDPGGFGHIQRCAVVTARLVCVLVRDLSAGQITMRAMGLVYTSLLSLVPLLALAFSLLKAFGMNNTLRPMLERFLAPLGERGGPLVDMIVGFVDNVQVGVLGVVGLVILLYSVISLIQKIEVGCNAIWKVRSTRSLGRRFTEYLSLLLVGPLVMVAAISMTASLASNTVVTYLSNFEVFGTLLYVGGKTLPYVMYSAAFTFLYSFMPNTRVHILPALGGGLFAGILWQTASVGFTTFAANAGNVNAIYSGFAILILLLIWLYVSWLIMLTGCRVAFLLQHQEQLTRAPYPPPLSNYQREELAVLVCTLIADSFLRGDTPWPAEKLARHLRVPPSHVYAVVSELIASDILIETDHAQAQLLPRQDIAELRVDAIIHAVRGNADVSAPSRQHGPHYAQVASLLHRADTARSATLDGLTLRELATRDTSVTLASASTDSGKRWGTQ